MYVNERSRREVKKNINTENDWLKKINTTLKFEEVNKSNIVRTLQLINKTNQLNLTTRRLTESKLTNWLKKKENHMMTVETSDNFGNMGIVGVIGINLSGKKGILTDYILSCRVMGRKVESTMLYLAAKKLLSLKADSMHAKLIPTKRNRPTIDIFRASEMKEKSK